MRTVFLLCGGKGTRLSSITQGIPKPLVPFPGSASRYSLLEQIIFRFRLSGINNFVLVVSSSNSKYFDNKISDFESQFGCSFSLLQDPPGTFGTASWLSELSSNYQEIIIANGDTYLSGNLFGFLATDFNATIGVWNYTGEDTGLVEHTLKTPSKVVKFSEKDAAKLPSSSTSFSSYSGIIVLKDCALQAAKKYVQTFPKGCSLEYDLIPFLLRETDLYVSTFLLKPYDIGTVSRYNAYSQQFPEGFTNPVIFWDRDNTLNYDNGYSHDPLNLEIIQDRVAFMQYYSSIGYSHIVVSNQSGIARKYFTEAQMHSFNEELNSRLSHFGVHISEFFWCPHLPASTLDNSCHCRKPKPGMLEEAIKRFNIDLTTSFLIGDKITDIEAASSINLPGLFVQPGSSILRFLPQ